MWVVSSLALNNLEQGGLGQEQDSWGQSQQGELPVPDSVNGFGHLTKCEVETDHHY